MIFQKPYIGTGRFGDSVVKVMGTEATTKRYIEIDLYPSKLFQNIVQAIARDVLVNAMEQITDDTGNLVASFHDEILLTTDKNKGEENLHQLIQTMSTSPPWATDLPLTASGWTGNRFRK